MNVSTTLLCCDLAGDISEANRAASCLLGSNKSTKEAMIKFGAIPLLYGLLRQIDRRNKKDLEDTWSRAPATLLLADLKAAEEAEAAGEATKAVEGGREDAEEAAKAAADAREAAAREDAAKAAREAVKAREDAAKAAEAAKEANEPARLTAAEALEFGVSPPEEANEAAVKEAKAAAATRVANKLLIEMTTDPVRHDQPNTALAVETNEIPLHYRLEHVHYELDSEAPMTASKSIGKAIKKGMRYVNYKHKETGSLKEIELGLAEPQIRARLKAAKQASGRKVERQAQAMKKAKTQVGFAARSLDAICEDGIVLDDMINQLASTCKILMQARKKQKTHICQAGDNVAKVSTTLEDGMA